MFPLFSLNLGKKKKGTGEENNSKAGKAVKVNVHSGVH